MSPVPLRSSNTFIESCHDVTRRDNAGHRFCDKPIGR